MRLLIVKTSSLGDIIHTLPALEDARRAIPQLQCDWLAERAFAQVPTWHPAVQRVIECDLRRWRRELRATLAGGVWASFRDALRREPYDLVLDAQGLLKSALLARQARGPRAGPDWHAAREPLAALFYDRRYRVPRHGEAHAVTRSRMLFAQALDYPLPACEPDAGLPHSRFERPTLPTPWVVLLHGTTWPTKRWPTRHWQTLAQHLRKCGLTPVLPWGSEEEHAEATRIAGACEGLVLPRLDLATLAGWIAHARCVVGVDTGLAHLAAALAVPQITLYGPTLPAMTGAVGPHQVWLRSGEDRCIDRQRPTTVAVERVIEAVDALLSA